MIKYELGCYKIPHTYEILHSCDLADFWQGSTLFDMDERLVWMSFVEMDSGWRGRGVRGGGYIEMRWVSWSVSFV